MSHPVFDLQFLTLIKEKNGNKYYIIPAGTKIYRGGYPADMHPNAFFGFNPDHVKQYGSVTEYTIKENLKVLALMEMDDSSNFYTNNTEIQDALIQSYSYTKPKKIRDSIPAYDYAVVNHICNKTDYDGYAMHDGYKTDSRGTFHAELVICDCYDRVEQGAKGEQAAPRVKRKKRPVVEQTNFYFVEEDKQSSFSSSFGTPTSESLFSSPLGTPQGESLFSSPLGTPKEKELGSRLEKTLETPNGFIPFNLYSPDTKSPLKLILEEEDKSKARSMLFGSPQQDPVKLKNGYNNEGMKDTTAVKNLNFDGGKRKTKRRNRKTKRKTKRRRNRRTRKGGLFNNRKYTREDVINYVNGLGDIYDMGKDQKTELLEVFEDIKNTKIEACTSLFKRDMKCEYEKIHEIYEVIINKLQSLSTRDSNIITRRDILINYFQQKLDDHIKKIGYSDEYYKFERPKIQAKEKPKIQAKEKPNMNTINQRWINELEDSVVSNSQNKKKVTFVVGGKRKTKRRKTRTKHRRNRRTKKVKH
jgi:hypothetical protein